MFTSNVSDVQLQYNSNTIIIGSLLLCRLANTFLMLLSFAVLLATIASQMFSRKSKAHFELAFNHRMHTNGYILCIYNTCFALYSFKDFWPHENLRCWLIFRFMSALWGIFLLEKLNFCYHRKYTWDRSEWPCV